MREMLKDDLMRAAGPLSDTSFISSVLVAAIVVLTVIGEEQLLHCLGRHVTAEKSELCAEFTDGLPSYLRIDGGG